MANHNVTGDKDLLPLDEHDSPWLYEFRNNSVKGVDVGKWMLFYDKALINEAWILAKKLYKENRLDGVTSMKCSTSCENPRAKSILSKVIILYCSNSSDMEAIMNIGKKILETFECKEQKMIYYKTDLQTQEGTSATGNKKNHSYKLVNPFYKGR